jgi:hypothetical protein
VTTDRFLSLPLESFLPHVSDKPGNMKMNLARQGAKMPEAAYQTKH